MINVTENLIYISISTVFILFIIMVALSMIKKKDNEAKEYDRYSANMSSSSVVTKLNKSKIVNAVARSAKADTEMQKLFDNSKNPWGVTPTIFKAIRTITLAVGILFAGVVFILFDAKQTAMISLMIAGIGWWYPMYYYKAIAKEREQEWDKIYEFIWVFKNSSMLYDAKKVCLEARDYILKNYPQHKEIIEGLTHFHEHWDDHEIPEYILRYYSFPIPKELYSILFNMNLTGVTPDSSLDNLRSFALNKHNGLINKTLSKVPSKATIGTLPFLMISVIIALLVPMMSTFFRFM